jgi:signal transduction histidine kinase
MADEAERWRKRAEAEREARVEAERIITERVRELFLLNQQLSKTHQELKEAQARAVQAGKMQVVGQLAAGVAHEVNNPLGVILGFAQSLLKRMEPGGPFRMPLESIEREAQRCKQIVQKLLLFSRTSDGGKNSLNLAEVIEDTLALVEHQLQLANIEIKRNFDTFPHRVLGSKNQLQQVIMNLVVNARDAMPDGGKLSIALSAGKGKTVRIQVSDTGAGISEEVMQRLFDPFFTTKEPGKGTGLGLSVCREIIEAHGGKIRAESEPGKGSSFIITLPGLDLPGDRQNSGGK